MIIAVARTWKSGEGKNKQKNKLEFFKMAADFVCHIKTHIQPKPRDSHASSREYMEIYKINKIMFGFNNHTKIQNPVANQKINK